MLGQYSSPEQVSAFQLGLAADGSRSCQYPCRAAWTAGEGLRGCSAAWRILARASGVAALRSDHKGSTDRIAVASAAFAESIRPVGPVEPAATSVAGSLPLAS